MDYKTQFGSAHDLSYGSDHLWIRERALKQLSAMVLNTNNIQDVQCLNKIFS